MPRLAAAVLVLSVAIPAQETPKPSAPPPQAGLPPFPAAEAHRVIRGKVRADARIEPRLLPAWEARPLFPNGYPDPRRQQNALDLTLPGVLVVVDGAQRRWAFPELGRHRRMLLSRERVDRRFEGLIVGDTLELTASAPFGDLQLALSCMGVGFVLDGTGSVLVAVEQSAGTPRLEKLQPDRARLVLQEPCTLAIQGGSQAWWVGALVYCLPHPLFAITDGDGRFELPKMPAGEYEVLAVHELLGEVRQVVRIKDAHPPPVTFVFEAEWLRRQDRSEAWARAAADAKAREAARFLASSARRVAALCQREDDFKRHRLR